MQSKGIEATTRNLSLDAADRIFGESLQGTTDLRRRVICLVDTYVDFLNANRGFSRIVQREASGGKHMQQILSHMVPLFALGVDLVESAFPQNNKPALAAHHLLVSLYGMIGEDPLAPSRIEERKAHLHLLLDATLTLVDPLWKSKAHTIL